MTIVRDARQVMLSPRLSVEDTNVEIKTHTTLAD
jgi:hypothetical protein